MIFQVTAARLPYFDGDYWPGAAEDMIVQLQQEEEDVRKNALKKGKTKKQPTKRSSKGLAQVELASNASKDTQLMQKVCFDGKKIRSYNSLVPVDLFSCYISL
jgi:E1A/CREB-binding protein